MSSRMAPEEAESKLRAYEDQYPIEVRSTPSEIIDRVNGIQHLKEFQHIPSLRAVVIQLEEIAASLKVLEDHGLKYAPQKELMKISFLSELGKLRPLYSLGQRLLMVCQDEEDAVAFLPVVVMCIKQSALGVVYNLGIENPDSTVFPLEDDGDVEEKYLVEDTQDFKPDRPSRKRPMLHIVK